MRKADKNGDNMMSLKEVKHFLRQINVEVSDAYAEDIFKVRRSHKNGLTFYGSSCLKSGSNLVDWLSHNVLFCTEMW